MAAERDFEKKGRSRSEEKKYIDEDLQVLLGFVGVVVRCEIKLFDDDGVSTRVLIMTINRFLANSYL